MRRIAAPASRSSSSATSFAEPCRGEVADEAHLDAGASEPLRASAHAEAETRLVADRPKDPRRVVDEREVVEDADRPMLEVAPAAERVDEAPEVLRLQRRGHRVDREVAAEEILTDGG